MKPGLTEYIKFSDGIQEKFGGLFVASYLIMQPAYSIEIEKQMQEVFDRLTCAVRFPTRSNTNKPPPKVNKAIASTTWRSILLAYTTR